MFAEGGIGCSCKSLFLTKESINPSSVRLSINVNIANFFVWAFWAMGIFAAAAMIELLYGLIVWPQELRTLAKSILKKTVTRFCL